MASLILPSSYPVHTTHSILASCKSSTERRISGTPSIGKVDFGTRSTFLAIRVPLPAASKIAFMQLQSPFFYGFHFDIRYIGHPHPMRRDDTDKSASLRGTSFTSSHSLGIPNPQHPEKYPTGPLPSSAVLQQVIKFFCSLADSPFILPHFLSKACS